MDFLNDIREEVIQKICSKVSLNGECIEFNTVDKDGYGQMMVNTSKGRKNVRVHRVMHFYATGENPPVVMHTCDNPSCCNPAHLRGGTHKDNSEDMVRKGRAPRGSVGQLTERQVKRILFNTHVSNASYAKAFGVSPELIRQIRCGLAYKGVVGEVARDS